MKKRVNRRTFFKQSGALGLSASVTAGMTGKSYAAVSPHKPFMDEYYENLMHMVTAFRDTQMGKVVAAVDIAYELKSKGGNIYSQLTFGHLNMFETVQDRAGNPNSLPQIPYSAPQSEYEKIGKGDFFITHSNGRSTSEARKRGAYIVGVTVCYTPFARSPEGGHRPGNKPRIEKVSDMVIDSMMPWDGGLVHAPEIPQFPIIPGQGIGSCLVYWTASAEFSNRLSLKKKAPEIGPGLEYINQYIERSQMIWKDRLKFDEVGRKMADLVLKGARMYVYGAPQENVKTYITGAKNFFVHDACVVASGPMITEPYNPSELKAGDIVLIGASISDNPLEIAAAREARRKGAYVISFGPYSTNGDSSGERLYKETDAAFNSFSPEPEGILDIKGYPGKVCPVSGITGDLVMWLLIASWTEHMEARGEMPYYYQGYFMREGSDYDNKVLPYFKARGY